MLTIYLTLIFVTSIFQPLPLRRLTEGLKGTKKSDDTEIFKLFSNVFSIYPPKVSIQSCYLKLFQIAVLCLINKSFKIISLGKITSRRYYCYYYYFFCCCLLFLPYWLGCSHLNSSLQSAGGSYYSFSWILAIISWIQWRIQGLLVSLGLNDVGFIIVEHLNLTSHERV